MINLDSLGRKYNTTDVISEISVCIAAGKEHQEPLVKQGVRPTVLTRLEELALELPVLDQDQVDTAKHQESCTDKVNRLMDQGVSTLGMVENLATDALLLTNPEALESLPSRSNIKSITNMTKALEADSAFAKVHKEALATTTAPPTLAENLAGDARRLQLANKEQEAAKKAAEAATRALARARGEAYMLIKKVYAAGKVEFRKEAAVKDLFKFQYLKRKPSAPKTAEELEAAARKRVAKEAAQAAKVAAAAQKKAAKQAAEAAKQAAKEDQAAKTRALPGPSEAFALPTVSPVSPPAA